MKYLVVCRGFIGDVLFASSIAKKLHEQDSEAVVDYLIPLLQPMYLLKNNPYINDVFAPTQILDAHDYDKVIEIPEVDQSKPVTIQFQEVAGITNPTLSFDVYTIPEYDEYFKKELDVRREQSGRKIIAWQKNWEYKAYQCTNELLVKKVGAPHRNIDAVIADLEKDYNLIAVGFDRSVGQYSEQAHNPETFAQTASLIKFCDVFIGSEGGLSNLACAVGTKCIITTDFIEQNYGPLGHVKQIQNPQMGPAVYYPTSGHLHLDPCIKDEDIAKEIRSEMKWDDAFATEAFKKMVDEARKEIERMNETA